MESNRGVLRVSLPLEDRRLLFNAEAQKLLLEAYRHEHVVVGRVAPIIGSHRDVLLRLYAGAGVTRVLRRRVGAEEDEVFHLVGAELLVLQEVLGTRHKSG